MSHPRRRPTGGIRKPQVAGRPRVGRPDDAPEESGPDRPGGVAVDERSAAAAADRPGEVAAAPADPVRSGGTGDRAPAPAGRPGPDDADADRADADRADADGAGSDGSGPGAGRAARLRRRLPLPPAPVTRAGTAALLAVTVLLTAAAVFFGVSWYRVEFTGPAANTALTDVGTTARVNEQIRDAVTKVYSFDYTRLDQAESEARAVVTPEFLPEFERIFGSVRELAPQQQAVVTATIPKSAVQRIDGDRASVYLFVNQVIRRQADGGAPQEGSAAARLRVEAQFLDGRWKIASMTPA